MLEFGGPDPRRLSEVTRLLVHPEGITGTLWAPVRRKIRQELGVTFDGWQDGIGSLALATRADGKLAATIDGLGISGPRQYGKALDVETPLLTVNRGWVMMADVAVGDEVMHPSGRSTVVTFVSPVMVGHDCYEVHTVDGRRLVADADHLWTVYDRRGERRRLMTTMQMIEAGVSCVRTVMAPGRRFPMEEFRFALPRQDPLELPDTDLPMDAYLLGAWLGDGTGIRAELWCAEQDLMHWCEAIGEAGFRAVVGRPGSACRVTIAWPEVTGSRSLSFRRGLRNLGVLGDKHVPDLYLRAGAKQREALLQGLLDTDGSISGAKGQIEFCSVNLRLAEAVLFLARSLGWRAVLLTGRAVLAGKDCGPRYRVNFTAKLGDPFVPFRMERKLARLRIGGRSRSSVAIRSITSVPSRPVRCIKVAAEDGLFLAGRDLVATHNTFTWGSIDFGMCLTWPGLKLVWSAHHSKTHMETFLYMQAFAKLPRVRPHISKVFTGSGDEEVRFVNGSRILFGARERGFGRGIPDVDGLLFDEAQILSEKALENMLATMNRSQLGLHAYLGTPPKPGDNCESFTKMRMAASAGGLRNGVWAEMGADPDATVDIDDPQFWVQAAKANPSYPRHTSAEAILRLRSKLTADGFRREGFGIWPAGGGVRLDLASWLRLEDRTVAAPRRVAVAVYVAPYRSAAAIGVAGDDGNGSTVMLVHCGEGMGWVPGKLAEVYKSCDVAEVALLPGEARGLATDLGREGIEFRKLPDTDVAASCTAVQAAITAGEAAVSRGERPGLVQVGQSELDTAVTAARTRRLGRGETWELEDDADRMAPIVAGAAAFYRWGLQLAPMPAIY